MTIKALTFDTGGTILDWHTGISQALQQVGNQRGITRDWHTITNDYRRQVLKAIAGQVQPAFNMDGKHRSVLDDIVAQHDLRAFTPEDLQGIYSTWHALPAWPDFPAALARIRTKLPAISFTLLPFSLVVDVARKNGFSWDGIISCEMIGVYKPRPEAYLKAAQWLNLAPQEIMMVACHNFDLDAARACGFKTAFVRRPDEWGTAGPPDPTPNPACDLVVDGFEALATLLGCD